MGRVKPRGDRLQKHHCLQRHSTPHFRKIRASQRGSLYTACNTCDNNQAPGLFYLHVDVCSGLWLSRLWEILGRFRDLTDQHWRIQWVDYWHSQTSTKGRSASPILHFGYHMSMCSKQPFTYTGRVNPQVAVISARWAKVVLKISAACFLRRLDSATFSFNISFFIAPETFPLFELYF